MISPISSLSSYYQTGTTSSKDTQKPPQQNTNTPQDTVHLSKAAQAAAAGDVDHDGDSH